MSRNVQIVAVAIISLSTGPTPLKILNGKRYRVIARDPLKCLIIAFRFFLIGALIFDKIMLL